jgi:lysophospholipase L1-like esterase
MKVLRIPKLVIAACLLYGITGVYAQDPLRFKDQVEELSLKEYDFSKDDQVVLFTGSSSIRRWTDIQSYFPEHKIINNGFGGSHMSDLIYYYNEIIFKWSPSQIFIYEGDNDINDNKRPAEILRTTRKLIGRIQIDLPETEVIIISPKPSIARWDLAPRYQRLNRKLSRYCDKNPNLEFADVWKVMLDENGMVFQDIFVEDNLHMNKKGYDLWAEFLGEYLQ